MVCVGTLSMLPGVCVQGRVSHENLSDKGKERDKIFDEMQLKDVVQGERWLCQVTKSFADFFVTQEWWLVAMVTLSPSHLENRMLSSSVHMESCQVALVWCVQVYPLPGISCITCCPLPAGL